MYLIDGDVIAYSCAAGAEGGDESEVDELIFAKLENFDDQGEVEVFLTGKGNFRLALYEKYKANRKGKAKPEHLGYAREFLIKNYAAVVSEGCEADDLIAIKATSVPDCTIVSSDKDFRQIPGKYHNLYHNTTEVINREEADKFFYTQILTGDTADNVPGLWRCGPVKAKKILADAVTPEDLWSAVVSAYEDNDDTKDNAILMGQLLWLQRKEGELWSPPE